MLPRLLVAILVVLTGATSMAHACSCARLLSKGCDKSWDSGGIVFAGTVTAKTLSGETSSSGGYKRMDSVYAFHFSDVEMFRGNPAHDKDLVVYTGMGGGDCGYPFQTGTRYLVYASAGNGQLMTGICSSTAPEITAGSAIKELRALRDTGHVDDLFGNINEAPKGSRYEDLVESHPLAGVAVRVIGSRGQVFATTSDAHGIYSFSTLPYGNYRIEPDLPSGLVSRRNPEEPILVELSDQGALGAGCGVDISAVPDGLISGKVVDGSGNGLVGFVTVRPSDPAEAKLALQRGGLPGCDTDDGNFKLSRLHPGRYQLIFHPIGASGMDFRHTFYWPAGKDSGSDGIELVLGQHVENIRFEVAIPSASHSKTE